MGGTGPQSTVFGGAGHCGPEPGGQEAARRVGDRRANTSLEQVSLNISTSLNLPME
jgi:hypothetical protein